MNNKVYLSLGKILITVTLLAVVFLVVDFRKVGAVLKSVDWRDMLTATAIYQLGIFVRAYRWQVLLRAQDMYTPYCRLVQLYYIGSFFNTFLPSGFGGDVVKTYELSRQTSSGASSVSTVLVDRLMGLAVLFAMHDLNLVSAVSDRVVLLVMGKMIANGTPHEVLTPDLLSSAYEVPVRVIQELKSGNPIIFPRDLF